MEIDHYRILGLPSGEEGTKLTLTEIRKAYKKEALILHPDKNPNNPNATSNFSQLKSSYEILKHESSRKVFDDLLKLRDRKLSAKRRRMVSDRKRSWAKAKREEKRKFKEVRRFKEIWAKKSWLRARVRLRRRARRERVMWLRLKKARPLGLKVTEVLDKYSNIPR